MTALFHPLVQSWFTDTYGKPTAVQEAAWPFIAAGEHALALAPTGSGKTLTAFLAAISRFALGTYPADQLSVLYVSPLKALNEDIRRNLLEPIGALADYFARRGAAFPDIRVETRSGDTPPAQRRRFLTHPPSILALTPESLAILLLNPRGRRALSTVKYLIIDEIHAVLGAKRGAFLSCQIDRLALIAGEFQRVSLSATVRPPEAAAEFIAGLRSAGRDFEKRPIRIVAPPAEKALEFIIDFPESPSPENGTAGAERKADRFGERYTILVDIIMERIAANRPDAGASTGGAVLVFTDSRRRAERIAMLLNQRAGGAVAFAHHGSLSKEVRRAVELRLVRGELPCVVATGSLELGIDIGAAAEVILAGSPGSVSAALQRIGRSGHGVGMTSRGRLVPFTGLDLLAAAALEGAVKDWEIEEVRPIENPLDILAQVILELCAEKNRNIDELYDLLRGFYVFKTLSRASYDLVIQMLTGRFASSRIRELKGRLYLDALTGELCPADGLLTLLYSSGGVIANRGSYSLRLPDGTKIGELDEEFVWERRLGDRFTFGTRSWAITAIGSEAVEAAPLDNNADYAPFWKGDPVFRSPVLVRRMLELLDGFEAFFNKRGNRPAAAVIKQLEDFIRRQRKAQGAVPLPGIRHIAIEIIDDPLNRSDAWTIVFHTFRGGAVNYPLAMALSQELEDSLELRVEAVPDDNAILIRLPRLQGHAPEALIRQSLLALTTPGEGGVLRGEAQFRRRLESSGIFGAAFREAAERSLALPKAPFGKRIPLWITRQRSKRLFDLTARFGDFPITAEAWRTCLRDQADPAGFAELLVSLRDNSPCDTSPCDTTAFAFFHVSSPSPFARDIVWKETNILMYTGDERPDLRGTSLSDQAIQAALGEGAARPALPAALVDDFSARLRRERSGWTPEDVMGLTEWVKERIAIPEDEWESLLAAAPPELREACKADPSLGGKLRRIQREGAALASVVHREWADLWLEEALAQLGPWLRYEGPLSPARIRAVFGVSPTVDTAVDTAVSTAVEAGIVTRDVAVVPAVLPAVLPAAAEPDGGMTGLICDRENLELLLRLLRRQARPEIRERPAALLIPFLARRQGIIRDQDAPETPPAWDAPACFSAPAALWETEIFPCRCPGYRPEFLEQELREGRLLWYGGGRERVAFCAAEDLALVRQAEETPGGETFAQLERLLERKRDFWEIKEALGLDNAALVKTLWDAAWQGLISADSFEPVRRGITRGFTWSSASEEAGEPEKAGKGRSYSPFSSRFASRPIPRALRDRWRAGGAPVEGRWFSLAPDYGAMSGAEGWAEEDALDEEELNRDRVRLLARRWGILYRPLLEREAGPLGWARLLPAMRRMELAGELIAGRFFSGIPSLQFAPPGILGDLEAADSESAVYWMNAADPASPAALGIGLDEGFAARLPARLPTNRLCFRGAELLAVSTKSGKELAVFVPPEDPALPELLEFIRVPRTRAVSPQRKIVINRINAAPAAESAYAPALEGLGFIRDRGTLALW